jgi:hypothetical protein
VSEESPAGSDPKRDRTPPTIADFVAYPPELSTPGSIILSATVGDPESGVLKVEFYETGRSMPVAISTAPPYEATVPLGFADNGERSYYAVAYDLALNQAGVVEPNVASNLSNAEKITVAIPDNTLERVGSLESEFGFAEAMYIEKISADPHSTSRFFVSSQMGSTLRVDFTTKTVRHLMSGAGRAPAVDPQRPNRLVSLLMDGSISESLDAGDNWTTIGGFGTFGFGADQFSGNLRHLEFSPEGGRLYAFSEDQWSSGYGSGWAFGYSTDGGVTWTRPDSGLVSGPGVGPIATSPSDPSVVYVISMGGVHRSSNGGQTFSPAVPLPTQSPSAQGGMAIAADPYDANHVLVTMPRTALGVGDPNAIFVVFRSRDGGATWNPVTLPALPAAPVGGFPIGGIVFNRFVPGLIYISLAFGEDGGSFLRTKDSGGNWEVLSYFDPEARGFVARSTPRTFVSSHPDSEGVVSLLVPAQSGNKGFWHYLDRHATD